LFEDLAARPERARNLDQRYPKRQNSEVWESRILINAAFSRSVDASGNAPQEYPAKHPPRSFRPPIAATMTPTTFLRSPDPRGPGAASSSKIPCVCLARNEGGRHRHERSRSRLLLPTAERPIPAPRLRRSSWHQPPQPLPSAIRNPTRNQIP